MKSYGHEPVDFNWGEVWIARQEHRGNADNPEVWDKRAPNYGSRIGASDYILQFIDKVNVGPGDEVMDMGCGPGTIALLMADKCKSILACDFSTGMLEQAHKNAAKQDNTNVTFKHMSWEDDWQEFGIEPNSVDIAYASRSVITHDLRDSLLKLSRTARRKACVTLNTGYSPKVSGGIMRELGVTIMPEYDYQYAFNILIQEGLRPSVSYICNDRRQHFESFEHAHEVIAEMITKSTFSANEHQTKHALEVLPEWLKENLKDNEKAGTTNDHGEVEGPYAINVKDDVVWAFLSWDTQDFE